MCNVFLHSDDLTLFCKKIFNGPFFTNLRSNESQNMKKPLKQLKELETKHKGMKKNETLTMIT